MRSFIVVGAVAGVLHAAEARALRGDPSRDAERIVRLVKQLGDPAFRKRSS